MSVRSLLSNNVKGWATLEVESLHANGSVIADTMSAQTSASIGDLNVLGAFVAETTAQFDGIVTANADLNVLGSSDISGSLGVGTDCDVSGSLGVGADCDVSGNMNVYGLFKLNGDLDGSPVAYTQADVSLNRFVDISSNYGFANLQNMPIIPAQGAIDVSFNYVGLPANKDIIATLCNANSADMDFMKLAIKDCEIPDAFSLRLRNVNTAPNTGGENCRVNYLIL